MQFHKLVACSIVVALSFVAFGSEYQSHAQVSVGNSTVSLANNLAINGVLRGMQPFIVQDPDGVRRVVITHIASGGSIAEKAPRIFPISNSCSANEINARIPVDDYEAHPHVIHVFDCAGGSLADSVWFMPAGGIPRLVWSRP